MITPASLSLKNEESFVYSSEEVKEYDVLSFVSDSGRKSSTYDNVPSGALVHKLSIHFELGMDCRGDIFVELLVHVSFRDKSYHALNKDWGEIRESHLVLREWFDSLLSDWVTVGI